MRDHTYVSGGMIYALCLLTVMKNPLYFGCRQTKPARRNSAAR